MQQCPKRICWYTIVIKQKNVRLHNKYNIYILVLKYPSNYIPFEVEETKDVDENDDHKTTLYAEILEERSRRELNWKKFTNNNTLEFIIYVT